MVVPLSFVYVCVLSDSKTQYDIVYESKVVWI